MTNPDYTAIMLLIDRSGSMDRIRRAAEDGINEFIRGQSGAGTPGHRTIRIAKFDNQYDAVCESLDPAGIEPFQLAPRGSTALLDAMGRAINEFGEELAALPEHERPGTVILAVMTDGLENASREHTWDQIKVMVQRQEHEFGWQVLYLGANQDAIEVGSKLGVSADRSMTYTPSDHGTRSMTRTVASYVESTARGGQGGFTQAQRDDATR